MAFDSVLRGIYGFSFDLLGIHIDSGDMSTTVKNLLSFATLTKTNANTGEATNFTLYNYVADINTAVQSVALSILTIFFMIGLIKLLTQEGVERISWERIVLKAAVYFILYALIINSLEMFSYLGEIVDDVYTTVTSKLTLSAAASKDIPQQLYEAASDEGIEKYLYYAIYIILAVPYNATIIMILSQVFLRAVKLLIYMMFAPIPIALAAEGETFRGKAISYFTGFAGVCFEAVFIYIGLFIYMTGMSDLPSGALSALFKILFLNGLFSAIISMSSQLSEKMFGRG